MEALFTRTSRSATAPVSIEHVTCIPEIDISKEKAGQVLVSHVKPSGMAFDLVIITAGYFGTEIFEEPSWQE